MGSGPMVSTKVLFAALVMGALLLPALCARGAVDRIEITSRAPVAGGRAFGAVGPYEILTGRLHYLVDPGDPANQAVVDLDHAPRDATGRVAFAGDFMLLKPVDLARGNHRLLYEVNNRGNLLLLSLFNDAPWSNRPAEAAHLGTGFLLERGYSLLWSAWNWDVLPGGGRLQIDLPVALRDGRPITGPVAAEISVAHPSPLAPVAWGRSRGYPPDDPADPAARLTVRERPGAARREIPRAAWRFVLPPAGRDGPVRIALDGGFQPGPLYELVYRAKDPRVVGLGLAAIRDALAFFRYARADGAGRANPLAVARDGTTAPDPVSALAFGFSQSARVLQHMIWQGFHIDEAGRPAFDAAFIHGAGAGKGSFNHRFAQTTRHPSHYEDHLYPADFFPFATTRERDPATGEEGSLLDRARALGAVPLRIYTATATEYWTRAASLLHSDVTGARDLPLDRRARLYVIAGAQHGVSAATGRGRYRLCGNPLDYRPLLRALLSALDAWATRGTPPPESVYPKIADATLGDVAGYRAGFPSPPGLRLPKSNLRPPRLDLGPRFKDRGVAEVQPARPLEPFATLVPLPDSDGNDLGGIRLPAVAVPLGSYLGWNLRRAGRGAPGRASERLGRWRGAFLPFALDRRHAGARGDPRPSILERYPTRGRFLERTGAATQDLVRRRLLLAEDEGGILGRAGALYDALMDADAPRTCAFATP